MISQQSSQHTNQKTLELTLEVAKISKVLVRVAVPALHRVGQHHDAARLDHTRHLRRRRALRLRRQLVEQIHAVAAKLTIIKRDGERV